jgi:hybrid cluster-associated redox disulfide protein
MNASQVSASQIVKDIMIRWPQTIPVFLDHRMNCVGCSMAAFEVLHDALNIYSLPVEPFVAQLNQIIERTNSLPSE